MFREKKYITEKIKKKKKRSEIPKLVVTVGIDVWNSTLALTRTAISGMDEVTPLVSPCIRLTWGDNRNIYRNNILLELNNCKFLENYT
jgi:hypothetical protein